jgi:glutamine amidotransferase
MCRFVAYMGKESILLADILIKPKHSLIKQSLLSRESRTVTNGDGFGLGWYTTFSKNPALFTSLYPAWNDRNLSYLAKKTRASLFFGHVRAASSGGISQFNCHPFLYKNWMFMHNGGIPHFENIKRKLYDLLDDDIYKWIQGGTDSEVIFALFLQLAKQSSSHNLKKITTTLQKTLNQIDSVVKKHHEKGVSYFNICMTDGKRLIAFRYCTSKQTKPETMYLSIRKVAEADDLPQSVVIASEKLTDCGREWKLIPANSCVMIESSLDISIQTLNEAEN